LIYDFNRVSLLIPGEVNTISDLPSYTKYWRNKFERRLKETSRDETTSCDNKVLNVVLKEYTTCLQMEVPETENNLPNDTLEKSCKQDFYFLSDVLQEDKVR